MPLKLKVVLGPIAKYKQFGIFEFEQPINNNLFRQIPLETFDLRSFDICHFHAGDVDDWIDISLQTISWNPLL